jgi:putative sterol carrier protein
MADTNLIITKAEAVALGLKHYYTGVLCKRGHDAKRRISSNDCVVCSKERQQSKEAKEYKQRHYLNKQEQYKAAAIVNYKKNKFVKLAYSAAYQKENLPKINAHRSERKKHDLLYREKERIRCLIKQSLVAKGYSKNSSTFEILGCSYEQWINHIEKQFLKGMTWENRNDWHIDHIVPIASAKSVEDLIKLNHFTNMRPIWAKDNLAKSAKRTFLI